MLKMRLQRIGRRNEAHFRVVVTDSKNGPKSGKFIEMIGSYNPKAGEVIIDADRAKHWLSVGTQASDTVHNFLVDKGVITDKKRNALPKKTPIVKEVAEEAPKPKTPAPDAPTSEDDSADTDETKEETPAEETKEESAKEPEETPADESPEEKPEPEATPADESAKEIADEPKESE